MSSLVSCDNCGKVVPVKESVRARQKSFSCSNSCRLASLVKRNQQRSRYADLLCPECGKIFRVRNCEAKKYRFCSLRCRSAHYRKHPEKHPQWQGGPVTKVCPICHRKFFVKQSRQNIRIYCSRQCYVESWGIKGFRNKPTKPEKALGVILDKHFPKEWKYTGDGSVRIGKRYPDFTNCNGRKAIIELFGDYWHMRPDKSWQETELGCIWTYRALGFNCLVIWEHELKHEEAVVAKIRHFMCVSRWG